jgi:hypothetical protein
MNQADSTDINMPKITVVKLLSGGLEVADFRKLAVAEQHFSKKLRKCFLHVAELRL